MKKATKKIIDSFPLLEKHIPDYDSVMLEQQTLDRFNETEQVFLRLIWFFENPEKNNFNLLDIYESLEGDWLSFAIESIAFFFEKDTFLLKEANFSLITERSELLNQSDFARFLSDNQELHNIKFSRQLISTYLKRGTLPDPDLTVAGRHYWEKETCENYLKKISLNNAYQI